MRKIALTDSDTLIRLPGGTLQASPRAQPPFGDHDLTPKQVLASADESLSEPGLAGQPPQMQNMEPARCRERQPPPRGRLEHTKASARNPLRIRGRHGAVSKRNTHHVLLQRLALLPDPQVALALLRYCLGA